MKGKDFCFKNRDKWDRYFSSDFLWSTVISSNSTIWSIFLLIYANFYANFFCPSEESFSSEMVKGDNYIFSKCWIFLSLFDQQLSFEKMHSSPFNTWQLNCIIGPNNFGTFRNHWTKTHWSMVFGRKCQTRLKYSCECHSVPYTKIKLLWFKTDFWYVSDRNSTWVDYHPESYQKTTWCKSNLHQVGNRFGSTTSGLN